MNILLPITITPAMIGAATNIPAIDPAVGEVAWVSGTNYAVGDRRVDAGYTHECVQAVTSAPQNTYAPSDARSAKHWLKDETAPTNRMAPFDDYVFTRARRQGNIKYVLTPPFFNGLAIYGAEADTTDITLRDQAGGTVLVSKSQEMWEQAYGEWEYLFGNLQKTTKYTSADLPMRPAAELEIVLSRNAPTVDAELGYLSVGQWQTLFAPLSNLSGTEYGAEVTPKSYSYFKRNDDGTYTRRKGRVAKVINASVLIDSRDAPRVADLLDKILDIPVAIEASSLPKYGHISTVGFVTGTVTSVSWGIARVNIKVDGNI